MLIKGGETETYEEVLSHEEKKEWLDVMQDEIKSL